MSKPHKTKGNYQKLMRINAEQQAFDNKTGILISHSLKRDRGSRKEVNELLQRFVYEEQDETDGTELTIEEQLQQELSTLKNKKATILDTGVECMLFSPTPVDGLEAVKSIFEGAKREYMVIKETQRIVPLQKAVMASSVEKLVGTVKELLSTVNDSKYSTFAITYNCRHNSTFTRESVIPRIAELVPTGWKVNLKDPDVTIVIEIFHRGMGVSLIDRETLHKYLNFNISRYLQEYFVE